MNWYSGSIHKESTTRLIDTDTISADFRCAIWGVAFVQEEARAKLAQAEKALHNEQEKAALQRDAVDATAHHHETLVAKLMQVHTFEIKSVRSATESSNIISFIFCTSLCQCGPCFLM